MPEHHDQMKHPNPVHDLEVAVSDRRSALQKLVDAETTDEELEEALNRHWSLRLYADWRSCGFPHRQLRRLPLDICSGQAPECRPLCTPSEMCAAEAKNVGLARYLEVRSLGMPHDEIVAFWDDARRRHEQSGDLAGDGRSWSDDYDLGLRLRTQAQLRVHRSPAEIARAEAGGVPLALYVPAAAIVAPTEAIEAFGLGMNDGYFLARQDGFSHGDLVAAWHVGVEPSLYRRLRRISEASQSHTHRSPDHATIIETARHQPDWSAVWAALHTGASGAEALEVVQQRADSHTYLHVRNAGRSHRFAMQLATNAVAVGLLPDWHGTFTELLKTSQALSKQRG